MSKQKSRSAVDLIYGLALFCVFAACALMVVMLGANVYKSVTAEAEANFDTRTGLSYIATKLEQNDTAGCVGLAELEGADALTLDLHLEDGSSYRTWLYCRDGSLQEQLLPADLTPDPAAGQVIMPLQELELELEQQLLKATATHADGRSETLYYTLRSAN